MSEYFLPLLNQPYLSQIPPSVCFTDGTRRVVPYFKNCINLTIDHILVVIPKSKHLRHLAIWMQSYKRRKPINYKNLHLIVVTEEDTDRKICTLVANLHYKLKQSELLCSGKTYIVKLYSWINEYYNSFAWTVLAEKVKQRDGFRCVVCNSDEYLQAHHRTYERLGDELLSDLTTLCLKCHKLFHSKEHK